MARYQVTVRKDSKIMYFDLEAKNINSLKNVLDELLAYEDIDIKEYVHKDYSKPPIDDNYKIDGKIKVTSNLSSQKIFQTFKIHYLKKNIRDTFKSLAKVTFECYSKKPDSFDFHFIDW